MCVCEGVSHSVMSNFAWTIAHKAPLSMEFSRQEYWSGLSFPSAEDLPNRGTEPTPFKSPALVGRFFYHQHHLVSPR